MNTLFIIFLVSLAVFLITRSLIRCDNPQKIIEYRYIPRTFQEEQKEPVKVLEIFDKMFQESSVLPNSL